MIAKLAGLAATAVLCMAVVYGVAAWLDYSLGSFTVGVTR